MTLPSFPAAAVTVPSDDPSTPEAVRPVQDFDDVEKAVAAGAARQITYADPQADNDTRALFGLTALLAVECRVGDAYIDDIESSLANTLGYLKHASDALGLDFDEALQRADRDYVRDLSGVI